MTTNESTPASSFRGSRRWAAVLSAGMVAAVFSIIILPGCSTGRKVDPPRTRTAVKTAASDTGTAPSKPVVERKPAPAVAAPDKPQFGLVSKQVTLGWNDEAGRPKMRATAREIVGNELTGKGTMRDATVQWFDQGKLTTVMTAPRIDAEQAVKELIATGGVIVRSIPRKTVVKSAWLKWYANDHKVIGGGGVTVTSDVGNVSAAGLVADTELKAIKFTSNNEGGSASFKP